MPGGITHGKRAVSPTETTEYVLKVQGAGGAQIERRSTITVKAPLPGFSVNGIGNASKAPIYGPGLHNWDISMFKYFKLSSNEARYLQFRFETYNTFNHTQYNGVDTGARFDQNNNQTNTNYGYFTNAAQARRLVLGLKLYF